MNALGTVSGSTVAVARPAALLDRDGAAGARSMLPLLVAYAPFALMVGAAVAASDNPLAAWLSTWTIYGGAAHLVTLDVLAQGVGVGRGSRGRPPRADQAVGVLHGDGPGLGGGHALAAAARRGPPHRCAVGAHPGTGDRPAWLLPRCRAHPLRRLAGHGHRRRTERGRPERRPCGRAGAGARARLHRPVLVASAAAGLSAVVTAPVSAGVALVAAAVAGTAAGLLADLATRGSLPGAVAS